MAGEIKGNNLSRRWKVLWIMHFLTLLSKLYHSSSVFPIASCRMLLANFDDGEQFKVLPSCPWPCMSSGWTQLDVYLVDRSPIMEINRNCETSVRIGTSGCLSTAIDGWTNCEVIGFISCPPCFSHGFGEQPVIIAQVEVAVGS